MFRCRKMRGLMAAAVYEPLDETEQSALENHLAGCPACQTEAEALRATASTIPTPTVVFEGDLLPALRERLREEPAAQNPFAWRPLAGAAALVLVAAFAGITAYQAGQMPSVTPIQVMATPMESALIEARALARRDFLGAHETLVNALGQYPEDPRAGEAQNLLADLEFQHGQRYAQAYQAYDTLRRNYTGVFAANPENLARFNLLDETRAAGFSPLYALDAARNSAGDPLLALENVVARYPNSYLAAQAIDAMCEVSGASTLADSASRAALLEEIRARCSDPIAIGQINLALGHLYWNELNDSPRAKECFIEAAESGHAVLAQAAREAMLRLDEEQ